MKKNPKISWKPIIKGPLVHQSWAYIEKLDKDLYSLEKKYKETPSFQLFSAGTGAALFLYYLHLHSGEKQYEKRAHSLLAMASAAVGLPNVTANYATGFLNAAWVMEHIRNLRGRNWQAGKDPHGEVDSYLLSNIKNHISQGLPLGPYGLFDTWIGYGAYALERAPNGQSILLIKNILKLLNKTATHDKDTVAWFTPKSAMSSLERKNFRSGRFDLGVSHGNSGVIGFLAGALKLNIEKDLTQELLEKSIRWILAQEDGENYGFFVPLTSQIKRPRKKRVRLAWCYGDLGMASTLLQAARVLKNFEFEEEAMRVAKRAAHFSVSESAIGNAYFCHGAVGAYHMLNRFYQNTAQPAHDPLFLKKSEMWLRKTFVMLAKPKEKDQETFYNIIDGETGVGLALLAGLSKIPPSWDRFFMANLD